MIASTGVAAVASCEPAQCRQALHVVSEVSYRGIYASLNGDLRLDDVELLSAKQIRLTCRRVVLRVACVSVSVTFATW